MKNLIGMVDFVLEQNEKLKTSEKGFNIEKYDFIINTLWYAGFLKKPLELWMFVPCDKDGNVIPDKENHFTRKELQEYQQAKERCLFEGFELKGKTDFSFIFKHNGIFPVIISKKREIEYLVTILKREIQLTPTTQKQLSL